MGKKKKSTGVSDSKSGVKPETREEEGVESSAEEAQEEGSAGFLSRLRSDAGEADTSEASSEDGGNEPESSGDTALVTSLWPSRLIVNAVPSGNRYVWPSAGSTVEVASEDIPFLREKNRTVDACCGSSGERRYFDL